MALWMITILNADHHNSYQPTSGVSLCPMHQESPYPPMAAWLSPTSPLSRSSKVTYDLARQMEGAEVVSCATFAEKAVESI